MTDTKPLLLTIIEAADRLSLSRSAIYEMINAGELKTVRYGRAVRITPAELTAWIDRHTDQQWQPCEVPPA